MTLVYIETHIWRTEIVMLMKLQALNIFSKEMMAYVLPALQLGPLRSSATNTA